MLRTGGQSTTLVNGGRKKVHTTFDDGSELVRAPLSTRTLHRAASSPRLPDVRHTAAPPQRNATQRDAMAVEYPRAKPPSPRRRSQHTRRSHPIPSSCARSYGA